MVKKVIGLCLCCLCVFAEEAEKNPLDASVFRPLNQQEAINPPEDLKIKKFYLNIPQEGIKEVQDKDKTLQETFDKFDESIVNYRPILRPINTNDEIVTHPYFTTTILLPAGSVISSVDFSGESNALKFEQNTILLRVKKNFNIANITAIYSLNEKNYVFNALVKRYDRQATDEKLNLVYSYKDIKKRDDLEIINLYAKEYGSLPKDPISYLLLDGLIYTITKDAKYGNIMIGQQRYKVSTGKGIE